MDYMQLKVTPRRATAIADAIERDIQANPEHTDRGDLSHALLWLRHRVASHQLRTANRDTSPDDE